MQVLYLNRCVIMQNLKQYLKENLNENQKRFIRKIRYLPQEVGWSFINPFKKRQFKYFRNLKLHVGCGDNHLNDFVNIDVRYTPAVDLILDLNHFNLFRENVDLIYSNAFFEHLFRNNRLSHLKGAYHALGEGGAICYIGFPNFKVVAKYYLEEGPGTVGSLFDLYNVYRYTHGDPEQVFGWYLEQLHKSLFDKEEVEKLLQESGFDNYVIFQYAFPGDANPVPVNLGFYALKNPNQIGSLRKGCLTLIENFPDKVSLNTVEFI